MRGRDVADRLREVRDASALRCRRRLRMQRGDDAQRTRGDEFTSRHDTAWLSAGTLKEPYHVRRARHRHRRSDEGPQWRHPRKGLQERIMPSHRWTRCATRSNRHLYPRCEEKCHPGDARERASYSEREQYSPQTRDGPCPARDFGNSCISHGPGIPPSVRRETGSARVLPSAARLHGSVSSSPAERRLVDQGSTRVALDPRQPFPWRRQGSQSMPATGEPERAPEEKRRRSISAARPHSHSLPEKLACLRPCLGCGAGGRVCQLGAGGSISSRGRVMRASSAQ